MKKLKQKFNDLSIRRKLIILLCVVGFVPVTLLSVSIGVNAHQTVVRNRQEDMENSLELACASVNNQVSICEQMMRYFVYDQNVTKFLECDPEQKPERYGYYQELRSAISALQYQNLMMKSITIYSHGIAQSFGDETQPLQLLKEESWFQDDVKDRQWYYDEETGEMINLYRIPSYSGQESYAVVRTDADTLFQSLSQLATGNGGVSVYDEGKIWSSAGAEYVGENDNMPFAPGDTDDYILAQAEIENLGVTVVCFQPKSSVQALSGSTFLGFAIQIGACLGIILFLGRMFANYISRPLELLTHEIQTVDEHKIGTEINSDRNDETGILIRSYHQMMKRMQELIRENYETRIAQKEFEMKALQAQINPHFLYNSLSIINWKAIEAGEDEISGITLALSSFYRTTLNKGKTMVSIRTAIENIQAYLKLQLWMHDNDFKVDYEIDEGTFDYVIPSLIFQPFVENALEHGLDVKEDPDHQIWIRVWQDDAMVYVEIRDNGIGMDASTLAHILEYKAAGYGVKNVNDRMILHYGRAYGIQIESEPDQGTDVLLRFPKDQEENVQNAKEQ